MGGVLLRLTTQSPPLLPGAFGRPPVQTLESDQRERRRPGARSTPPLACSHQPEIRVGSCPADVTCTRPRRVISLMDWKEVAQRLRSHQALVVFAILSLVSLAVSFVLQGGDLGAWAGDVFLNFAFLVSGLVAAVLVGEWWLDKIDQRRWRNVEGAIRRRAMRAALAIIYGFAGASTIRQALITGPNAQPVPDYGDLLSDPSLALAFAKDRLSPAVSCLTAREVSYQSGFAGLASGDWAAMSSAVQTSLLLLAQTTVLFGERPAPSLQEAVLALEEAETLFIGFQAGWGEQRSGQGELAYQNGSLLRSAKVLQAAINVLGELAIAGRSKGA